MRISQEQVSMIKRAFGDCRADGCSEERSKDYAAFRLRTITPGLSYDDGLMLVDLWHRGELKVGDEFTR